MNVLYYSEEHGSSDVYVGVEDVGIIVLLVVLELVDGHELASLLDDVALDSSLVKQGTSICFIN